MRYRVQLLPVAERAIRRLPPEGKRRVQAAIELLTENPRLPACKKPTGRPEWRVRTGGYRVLYRIEHEILTIVVVDAGHRREIYR